MGVLRNILAAGAMLPGLVASADEPTKPEETAIESVVETVESQPNEPSFDASLDVGIGVANRYANLRSYIISDETSLQPYATLTLNLDDDSFKIAYWGDYNAGDGERVDRDTFLMWTQSLGELGALGDIKLGLGWNQYKVFDSKFEEWMLTLDGGGTWRPRFRAIHDYQAGDGQFYELSVNPVVTVGQQPIVLGANLLGQNHYASDVEGIHGARFDALVPLRVGEDTTVGFNLRYFNSFVEELPDTTVALAFINHRFDLTGR